MGKEAETVREYKGIRYMIEFRNNIFGHEYFVHYFIGGKELWRRSSDESVAKALAFSDIDEYWRRQKL